MVGRLLLLACIGWLQSGLAGEKKSTSKKMRQPSLKGSASVHWSLSAQSAQDWAGHCYWHATLDRRQEVWGLDYGELKGALKG